MVSSGSDTFPYFGPILDAVLCLELLSWSLLRMLLLKLVLVLVLRRADLELESVRLISVQWPFRKVSSTFFFCFSPSSHNGPITNISRTGSTAVGKSKQKQQDVWRYCVRRARPRRFWSQTLVHNVLLRSTSYCVQVFARSSGWYKRAALLNSFLSQPRLTSPVQWCPP